MATVDALSGTTSNTVSASAGGLSALTSEDFAKIIFAELGKQDPLQPSDTKALLEQISSLRSIQSNMDLSSDLQSLVSQNEFSSAATLIGKQVAGVDEGNERASGVVKSVLRTKDGAVVQLMSGERLKVSNLDEIVNQTTSGTNTSNTTSTGSGT
jgi:flagellar basal-body rod modification protein FlgD